MIEVCCKFLIQTNFLQHNFRTIIEQLYGEKMFRIGQPFTKNIARFPYPPNAKVSTFQLTALNGFDTAQSVDLPSLINWLISKERSKQHFKLHSLKILSRTFRYFWGEITFFNFRFDCISVRPIIHFQFNIILPHKKGTRWQHKAHNLANRSKGVWSFKTG